jgi:hypothetical protein
MSQEQEATPSRSRSRSTVRVSKGGRRPTSDVPPYDAKAVGRVAARVQIRTVDLLGSHFEREDDGPLPAEQLAIESPPDIGISTPEWSLGGDASYFGCAITFSTLFDDEPSPYEIVARFRLIYSISPGKELEDEDLRQFVYWNVVFNAWPYWREYVSSTINRAHLPPYIVPVMAVPRPPDPPPASIE